ncbi:GNAT family N-acetyltransferase [Streptomyces sp. RB6PN25]|uniref:GNAT family N-acetyltransferase n=1 Tax=Streptomyces humicola TaxID=2953240 RepID=A0ABT1Q735_9ACTN|nr:GNAT family N-acetyltransferase [Streptomyces humicola]MCQ4084620.1 GNAT family N-acetyltransferase [Streptomyces humicola]
MSREVRDLDVRYIDESEFGEWITACRRGFLRPPEVSDEELAFSPAAMALDPARTQGAFDGGRCVGTFRSFPRELTVPGGGLVPASAVSGVTVTATHRRRGLLSRMMAADLRASKEREEAVAILIAAEYPIYGRFGFGPATWVTDWTVDIPRAALGRYEPPSGGRIDLADAAEVRKVGPELHGRVRRLTPGAINRTENWWRINTGEIRFPSRPWTEPFHAVYRDAATGRIDGMLSYTIDDVWDGKLPQDTLTVRQMITATPRAERELWQYALCVDWVVKLASGHRAPDDILPLLLGDPRAARVTSHADHMWLRILDVTRALEARTYAIAGSLVLELHDAAGLASGRYRLDASPEGAEVRGTTAPSDLAMDIGELGALYLGDESAVRLAALGRIEEHRPGAAADADLLLRTSRRPWCPDTF